MDKIRAVNLGGWFVLERWMSESLFEGVVGKDETAFCLQKPDAFDHLKKHWETFITEEDFIWLAARKINLVRLPIPWWVFGESEPYFSCLPWLDQAMDWAKKHKIPVLLDLHTAPGCQNGFDNGGLEGVCTWHHDPKNIAMTVDVLKRIAVRYASHDALWGVEVLNEPHWDIDLGLLQSFYLDAYRALRDVLEEKHTIVFHDGFRNDAWVDFFTVNPLVNVVLDVHLYQNFDPKFHEAGIVDNLVFPLETQVGVIDRITQSVRCLVGEWSLGLHPKNFDGLDDFQKTVAYRAFAANQLMAWEKGMGWVFWSYKIESGRFGWNFRKLTEAGVLPNDYA